MRRGLSILVCTALILIGTVANIVAGPRKAAVNIGTTSPIHHPAPAQVDITGLFWAVSGSLAAAVPRQNREFGDAHHSAAVRLNLASNHQIALPLEWRQKCRKYPRCWPTW